MRGEGSTLEREERGTEVVEEEEEMEEGEGRGESDWIQEERTVWKEKRCC